MGTNPRYTFYMPQMEAMKKAASEDAEDVNGALFESLYWDHCAGKDPTIQDIIKQLYMGECTLREALLQCVEYIMYSGNGYEEFFDAIPRIARDACINSDWQTEGNIYFSIDRNVNCGNLYKVVEKKYLTEIEEDEFFEMLTKDEGKSINYDDIGEDSDAYSFEEKETIERYLDLKKMKDGAEKLVKSDKSMPVDFLNFIIDNWYSYFNKPETYVVIEFCVSKAIIVEDNSVLRKRLREFGKLYSMVMNCEEQYKNAKIAKNQKWFDGVFNYIKE